MGLQILPLEERIVFDAAVADHDSDHGATNDHLQAVTSDQSTHAAAAPVKVLVNSRLTP